MTTPIPYPSPSGSTRSIRLYMQDGFLTPQGADILQSQGVPWTTVARYVQDLDWWRKQKAISCEPPKLPWRVQSWGATLRLKAPDIDIWIDPGPKAPIPPQAPHLIIVTHAHYDHVAQLGAFCAAFPHTRVVMSDDTHFLLSLRSHSDAQLRLCLEKQTVRLKFGTKREIQDVRLALLPAGHLLGAAMVEIEREGDVILVTGDFALRDVGGLSGAPWPLKRYSIVLMEATSIQQGTLPVADPEANRMPFLQEVDGWLKAGHTRLLVCTQAMGQAQELYAALTLAQQAGAFPDIKVRLTGVAEMISRHYYDTLKGKSRVWNCPFYTLDIDEIPEQSIVITGGDHDKDSALGRQVEQAPDGACISAPLVFTHAGWGERMTWASGVPSYAVGLYDGYASSLHMTLSDIGRHVKALSQEGEEWLTNQSI
jgi:hypothetical protein